MGTHGGITQRVKMQGALGRRRGSAGMPSVRQGTITRREHPDNIGGIDPYGVFGERTDRKSAEPKLSAHRAVSIHQSPVDGIQTHAEIVRCLLSSHPDRGGLVHWVCAIDLRCNSRTANNLRIASLITADLVPLPCGFSFFFLPASAFRNGASPASIRNVMMLRDLLLDLIGLLCARDVVLPFGNTRNQKLHPLHVRLSDNRRNRLVIQTSWPIVSP